MLGWILTFLVVAAIAALLGFGRLAGVALSGARILILVVLVIFLLSLLGLVAL